MKHSTTAARQATLRLRDRIRQARVMLGMSRAELAKRVGVGASAAVQWEHENGTSPSVANLVRIAQITDVAFEWLATGRGNTRVGDNGEPLPIHRDSMALDLYEEQILAVARKVPRDQRELLLQYLQMTYPASAIGRKKQRY